MECLVIIELLELNVRPLRALRAIGSPVAAQPVSRDRVLLVVCRTRVCVARARLLTVAAQGAAAVGAPCSALIQC